MIAALCFGLVACQPVFATSGTNDQGAPAWQALFDGKTLNGWTAKIAGYDLGDNFGDTFRVANGAIQVNYDKYGGKFANRFGHLFYKSPFRSYVLRWEYRFFGEQLPDAPGWAYRNSGIMFHCQDPNSMTKDQAFPVCLEYQLLGGNGKDERHTGNVCTPGTNIHFQGKLWTQHCTDSTSNTYHGDGWVKAELEVRPSGRIVHRIEGKTVLEYEGAELDPNDADGKRLIDLRQGVKSLREGWIALQSESTPCEFRRIEIMELKVDGQRVDLPLAKVLTSSENVLKLDRGRDDGYMVGLRVAFVRGGQVIHTGTVRGVEAKYCFVGPDTTLKMPQPGDLGVPVGNETAIPLRASPKLTIKGLAP